jgi:uncharacterized protein (TIGR02271 family)
MATSDRSPSRDDSVAPAAGAAHAAVVPLMEERVEVGTATAPAGTVRVRVEIDEERERVAVAGVREEYQPSVRSVGQPADARRDPYLDGDEVVIPVYEERVVVERRLFLKEEVRLRRTRHVVHEDRDVPVRRERAVFERLHADGSWREVPASPGAPVAEHLHPDSGVEARE